jgi:diadenosine tetraphosphate (Ap4A) HIT family hydrolase
MIEVEPCVFCKDDFPHSFQLVSKIPKFWLFIHNKRPHTDYHGLIILKREAMERAKIGHISDLGELGDSEIHEEMLSELGKVLNRASRAIRECSQDIERVLIASLNTGRGTKHLHFHLIPKRRSELVKTVHNPELDGGGMLFLARKEIVADTFHEFLKSTSGCMIDKLRSDIDRAVEDKVTRNTEILRENFRW